MACMMLVGNDSEEPKEDFFENPWRLKHFYYFCAAVVLDVQWLSELGIVDQTLGPQAEVPENIPETTSGYRSTITRRRMRTPGNLTVADRSHHDVHSTIGKER
jgi:hypothetical protein